MDQSKTLEQAFISHLIYTCFCCVRQTAKKHSVTSIFLLDDLSVPASQRNISSPFLPPVASSLKITHVAPNKAPLLSMNSLAIKQCPLKSETEKMLSGLPQFACLNMRMGLFSRLESMPLIACNMTGLVPHQQHPLGGRMDPLLSRITLDWAT